MKQATDDLLRQALQLSPEERAALAATLIESLDQVRAATDKVASPAPSEIQT